MNSVARPAEEPAKLALLSAIRLREEQRRLSSDTKSKSWPISSAAAHTLLAWHISRECVVAALLSPLIEHKLIGMQALTDRFGAQPVNLAQRLVGWHASSLSQANADASEGRSNAQLRRLFWEAYLDLPGLPWLMLLLAYHHARTAHSSDGSLAAQQLAIETQQVFVPIAEMLGMWEIRRNWLDFAYRTLRPQDYQAISVSLGPIDTYTETGLCAVRDAIRTNSPASQAVSNPLRDKALAYFRFKEELMMTAASFPLAAPLELSPVHPSAGSVLSSCEHNKPRDELVSRLQVRLICATAEDCYSALGAVHRLGKPATQRFKERFDDFIAMPKPSGYQALHTAIIYRGFRQGGHPPGEGRVEQLLIDIRIVTADMNRLNEWGFVESAYRSPGQHKDVRVWWRQMDGLSTQLRTRYTHQASIQEFLRQHEPGSNSDPIYVFTPRGEVVLLPEGSTPVDLAYRIHTDVGHHAAGIHVNGLAVPHHYPLRDGDLVKIDDDPYFRGPDLAWLSFAATSSAREKIRRGLRNVTGESHEGRNRIVELLIRAGQAYWTRRRYRLRMTTAQLDDFLARAARVRGLPNLEALYEAVARDVIAPTKLVQWFISDTMSADIVQFTGERLPYPAQNIRVCEVCRPVPGQQIEGIEHSASRSRRLIIHLKGNEAECPSLACGGKALALRWIDPTDTEQRQTVLFQISAEDRRELLGDALDIVYHRDGTQLLKVDAHSNADKSAMMSLAVEADTLADLTSIQSSLTSVRGVRRVLAYPVDQSQRSALKPIYPTKRPPNPYTIGQEVYTRTAFYDREKPLDEMIRWLEEAPPTSVLVLHGQRRVGKTSLARYLMHEILPARRIAVPVYVTLQGTSRMTPTGIARYLASTVCNQFRQAVPRKQRYEEPVPWLSRVLSDIVNQLGGRRLLVILDELDALIKREMDGKLDPVVFHNLRALVNQRRDVNWMLIVQDNYFLAPSGIGSARTLFQQARDLWLTHLDTQHAERLILDPARRCGVEYEDPTALSRSILDLTAGNPFLIQLLCYLLVERAREHNRTNITADDLGHAVMRVNLDGARYFDHFIGNLTGAPKLLLTAIAHAAGEGEWVELDQLVSQLQAKAGLLDANSLRRAAEVLERQGMTETRPDRRCVRIPIRLFHKHVQTHFEVEAIAEEVRSVQTRNGRQRRSRPATDTQADEN